MTFKVKVLPSPKSLCGTRAHWDEHYQSLYYCDVHGGSIFRYDYNAEKTYSATVDDEHVVAFIIPVANTTKTSDYDEYALGLGRRVGIVHWDGVSAKAVIGPIAFEVEENKENNRWNAAKADPVGRFYGGTMRSEKCGGLDEVAAGSLYKYIKGDGVYELVDNIYVSNGLAWDQEKNKLYYIDSCKYDVKEYDWDPSTGDICKRIYLISIWIPQKWILYFNLFLSANERVVIDFSINGKSPGFLPDGLTIDTDGNLYISNFGSSNILKVDPK